MLGIQKVSLNKWLQICWCSLKVPEYLQAVVKLAVTCPGHPQAAPTAAPLTLLCSESQWGFSGSSGNGCETIGEVIASKISLPCFMRLAALPKTCHGWGMEGGSWCEALKHSTALEGDKAFTYGKWEGSAFCEDRPFGVMIGKVTVMDTGGSSEKSECMANKKQRQPGTIFEICPKWKKRFGLSRISSATHPHSHPTPNSRRSAEGRWRTTPNQLDLPNLCWPSAVWQMSRSACLHFQIIHSNVSWVSASGLGRHFLWA